MIIQLPGSASPPRVASLELWAELPPGVWQGCISFTATPSGGTPPYVLYEWKRDGASVGTNSSTLTLTYCSTVGQFAHFTDTISVTVADSQGREASAAKVLTVELLGCDVFGNNCVG